MKFYPKPGLIGNKNAVTHGMKKTSEYKSWDTMKQRCSCKNRLDYKYYGGRGIRVCKRWLNSFENFFVDMGFKPTSSHTLDRKDNNGDYTPNNCKWSTSQEQANNRSNNRILTYNGISMTLVQWSRKLGINRTTLHSRIRLNWNVERILTEGVKSAYN